MTDEITPVPVVEPEFKSTLTPGQLADALAVVGGRSFSGRHPELGKMINCKVCGLRHRETDVVEKNVKEEVSPGVVVKSKTTLVLRPKCEQVFTDEFKGKDGRKYHQYHEEEKDGEVIVSLERRTATPYGEKPTINQIIGAAAFNKKRFRPHPSKTKLLFIEAVRPIFQAWEDKFNENLDRVRDQEFREKLETAYKEDAQNMLHRARLVAARKLRKAGLRLNWGVK